ncbi:MAG: hypothetical protein ACQESF_02920 [Nanobdellota archaeon]
MENPQLKLPKDPTRVAELEKRLHKYAQELGKQRIGNPEGNPSEVYNSQTGYKAILSQKLCKDGYADVETTAYEISTKFGALKLSDYKSAVKDISEFLYK